MWHTIRRRAVADYRAARVDRWTVSACAACQCIGKPKDSFSPAGRRRSRCSVSPPLSAADSKRHGRIVADPPFIRSECKNGSSSHEDARYGRGPVRFWNNTRSRHSHETPPPRPRYRPLPEENRPTRRDAYNTTSHHTRIPYEHTENTYFSSVLCTERAAVPAGMYEYFGYAFL